MREKILFVKLVLFTASLLLAVSPLAAQHFVPDFIGNGYDHMNIRVMTALAGGDTLEAGDEIAVFDDTICCGVSLLFREIAFSDPSSFVMIPASRSDVGLNNGFTDGDSIQFKIWRAGVQKEFSFVKAVYYNPADGQIFSEPLNFIHNGSAFVKLTATSIPVAIAGNDTSVNSGTWVYLDGSKSYDEDGDRLSYKWIPANTIQLSSDTASKPYFMAPEVQQDSTLLFSLTVSDGLAVSSSDEILVKVLKTSAINTSSVYSDPRVYYDALSSCLYVNNSDDSYSNYELLSLNGLLLQKGILSKSINQLSIEKNSAPVVLLILYRDTKTNCVKMLISK